MNCTIDIYNNQNDNQILMI